MVGSKFHEKDARVGRRLKKNRIGWTKLARKSTKGLKQDHRGHRTGWTEIAGEAARVGRRSKENRKGRTEVAGKSSKG